MTAAFITEARAVTSLEEAIPGSVVMLQYGCRALGSLSAGLVQLEPGAKDRPAINRIRYDMLSAGAACRAGNRLDLAFPVIPAAAS